MENVFESIIKGLTEAVDDAENREKTLKRRVVTIIPVKKYKAEEILKIRKSTGMSQRLFAGYLGVSVKTVEAWESGTNHPSGTASRILNMIEMNGNVIKEFPFVQSIEK